MEIQNNNVGFVAPYGTEYAETASVINGFALGVQAVNPNATVYVKKLGVWADEVNEAAFAKELIDSFGCGVISQHCDSAQPQIAAQNAGVFGCGYNADMTKDAPNAHLTAALWNWNVYYKTAMEAAMKCETADQFVTTMGGSAYYGGLKEGFVDVSPLSENCAPNTEKAIEAVRKLIVEGKWDVFSGVKLSIAADGTVTQNNADLVDNTGKAGIDTESRHVGKVGMLFVQSVDFFYKIEHALFVVGTLQCGEVKATEKSLFYLKCIILADAFKQA